MASLTKMEKFRAKIDIEMDHVRARLIDLRAQAGKLELKAREELDKSLDTLDKAQGDLKVKLDNWTKAGAESGKELAKGIKSSAKELRKGIKQAYKKLP